MMLDQFYNNLRLDKWLKEQDKSLFPGEINYAKRLDNISEYLEKNFYPNVEKGALWNAIRSGDEPIYLNDHGKPHIDQVISRATDILRESKCKITPYEAYILLAAIYFHDVGNIYGRKKHEKTLGKIMLELDKLVGEETIEKRIITRIAKAHGGVVEGTIDDKDTIGKLEPKRTILNKPVCLQFLAALLKFADELADDYTRADRFMLENDLLEGSEVYHAYSKSLHSVSIHERDIILDFEMNRKSALRQYCKGDKFVYLVDEIYERTLKMHLERMYCMRFLRTQVNIDRIRVTIEVFENIEKDLLMKPPLETISYTLEETGYPTAPTGGIQELRPELCEWTGEKLKEKLLLSGEKNNG